MVASPVFDLHCDAVLKLFHKKCRFSNRNPESHADIPKMRAGNVDGVFFSLWSDPAFIEEDAVYRTQLMLDTFKAELETVSKDLYLSTTADDLDSSITEGKITAMMGIEGGQSINENLDHLRHFHSQGVRRMTLTHTGSTPWAGSATDDGTKQGLSDFGKDVVSLMNELGMVVDVAHTSERTFLDAVSASKKPVFCTHSLCRSIVKADRLASDEMISAIGESGGIFGITLLPAYFVGANEDANKKWMQNIIAKMNHVSGKGSTEEQANETAKIFMDTPPPEVVAPIVGLLPHLDHVISLIGEDAIGIGTDFDGMPFAPVGLEDCSKFDNLRQAMRDHGYSDQRIRKILGANTRRVLKAII